MTSLGGEAGYVRDTRQPHQDHHTAPRQGQCGRRNAHGVTGRINNPAQTQDEGDTEFGKQLPPPVCVNTHAALS